MSQNGSSGPVQRHVCPARRTIRLYSAAFAVAVGVLLSYWLMNDSAPPAAQERGAPSPIVASPPASGTNATAAEADQERPDAAGEQEAPVPETEQERPAPKAKPLIAVDPGHQRKGNNAPEPVGPDSRATKPKVSSGTAGVATRKPEYELTLEVSLLLKEELARHGYEVLMTRESHDVDISNKERAELANRAGAVLSVRIHADGDASPKARGYSVLYPSASVPATHSIAAPSKAAAAAIAGGLKEATGSAGRGLSERSDLSGFNWSEIPVVLVELGFMTNPEEDALLSDPEYQKKLVSGIVKGIMQYADAEGE